MSPDEFREAGTRLATCLRASPDVSRELGAAMLTWLEDPHGFPFECFIGITRACDRPHPICLRDQLCIDYAASLPKMSASKAAELIIERVDYCDTKLDSPEDYGPLFVVFYMQLKALKFEIPVHRTLRRVIS